MYLAQLKAHKTRRFPAASVTFTDWSCQPEAGLILLACLALWPESGASCHTYLTENSLRMAGNVKKHKCFYFRPFCHLLLSSVKVNQNENRIIMWCLSVFLEVKENQTVSVCRCYEFVDTRIGKNKLNFDYACVFLMISYLDMRSSHYNHYYNGDLDKHNGEDSCHWLRCHLGSHCVKICLDALVNIFPCRFVALH